MKRAFADIIPIFFHSVFFGIELLSLPTSHSPLDSFDAPNILSLCFALISSSLFLSTYLLRKIKDEIPLVTITTLKKINNRKTSNMLIN